MTTNHPTESSTPPILITPLFDGRGICITPTALTREAVDLWYEQTMARIANWEHPQYIILYDLTHVEFMVTPYLRQRWGDAPTLMGTRPSYVAVLIDSGLEEITVNMLLRQFRGTGAQVQRIFSSRQSALEWLSEMLDTMATPG